MVELKILFGYYYSKHKIRIMSFLWNFNKMPFSSIISSRWGLISIYTTGLKIITGIFDLRIEKFGGQD